MEAFKDTLPIVCNGFKGKVQQQYLKMYGHFNSTLKIEIIKLTSACLAYGNKLKQTWQGQIDSIL